MCVGNRRLHVEPAVSIHSQLIGGLQNFEDGFDTLDVLGERSPANFYFHDGIAEIKITGHFIAKPVQIFARIVIAASRINKNLAFRDSTAIPVCEKPEQRDTRNFRCCIPDGHVQHSNGYRPFAVTAGLLIAHENVPDAGWIKVVASVIQKRFAVRGTKARNEAVAQEAARRVTPVGIKAESDHRFAVANHVGDESKDTDRHLAEINESVADRRFDRHDRFADVNNLHEFTCRMWR